MAEDQSTQAEAGVLPGALKKAPVGKPKAKGETRTETVAAARKRGVQDPKKVGAPVIDEPETKAPPKEGETKPDVKGKEDVKKEVVKKEDAKKEKKAEPPVLDALGRVRVMLEEAIKADIDPFEHAAIDFADVPEAHVVDEEQTVAFVDYKLDTRKLKDSQQKVVFYKPPPRDDTDIVSDVLFDGEIIELDMPVRPTYREALFDGTVINTLADNEDNDKDGNDSTFVEDLFTEDMYAHKSNEDTVRANIQSVASEFMSFSGQKWAGVNMDIAGKYKILEQYTTLSQINEGDLSVANAARMHLAQTLFATCLEDIPEYISRS